MNKNVAGQKWSVFAWYFDTGLPALGIASSLTAEIRINSGTPTDTSDTNPTEIQGGVYDFDISQSESNGNKLELFPVCTDSEVRVIATPRAIYTDPAGYQEFTSPPAASAIADAVCDEALSGHSTPGTVGISIYDTLGYVTALRSALTDLRAAALDRIVGTLATGTHNPQSGDAYGRIGTNGSGLSAIGDTRIAFLDASILSRSSHSASDVWSVTTRTLSSFGSLVADIATSVWGAVTRTITGGTITTNNDKTGYTASTVSDKTGYSLSVTPPTAEQISDAVWDEVLSGHLTSGTTGNALNAAGASGDPWSTALPGAYGAGTAGKIVGDNINATISSRAVLADVTSALNTYDPPTKQELDTWGTTLANYIDTEVADIKAKTDQLTFTVANKVDATASISGGGDATEAHQLDMIDKLEGIMSRAHTMLTTVGTFNPATDSIEAIRDRGDLAWTTGGGLSGSNAVLFNIKDQSSVNILGAWVEVWDSANTAYYDKKQTNSSGNASFNMDAGTYTIRLVKPGYTAADKTYVVTAAATVPYTMSTYVIPAPSDPNLCRLYTDLIDPDGTAPLAADVTATMTITSVPDTLTGYSSLEPVNGIYSATTRIVYFDVVRLATGNINIPGFIGGDVTVPDTDTADIKTLII